MILKGKILGIYAVFTSFDYQMPGFLNKRIYVIIFLTYRGDIFQWMYNVNNADHCWSMYKVDKVSPHYIIDSKCLSSNLKKYSLILIKLLTL